MLLHIFLDTVLVEPCVIRAARNAQMGLQTLMLPSGVSVQSFHSASSQLVLRDVLLHVRSCSSHVVVATFSQSLLLLCGSELFFLQAPRKHLVAFVLGSCCGWLS